MLRFLLFVLLRVLVLISFVMMFFMIVVDGVEICILVDEVFFCLILRLKLSIFVLLFCL